MNFYDKISDEKYKYIINDIIDNSEIKKLDNIKHHGDSRLVHCLKVSYYSYKISKFFKLDYNSVARAGVLHDFYTDRTKYRKKVKDKIKLFSTEHPKVALKSSKELFNLNKKEEDIIISHMFPIDYRIPKYLESWIVDLVDDFAAIYEKGSIVRVELRAATMFLFLLMVNFIKMR